MVLLFPSSSNGTLTFTLLISKSFTMSAQDFTTKLLVDQSTEVVFKAIQNVRGWWSEEIEGKTVGIIGYGHTGKKFAKKLSGFDAEVIFHDIQSGLQDAFAKQVTLKELQQKADILSLHTPWTSETNKMVNREFINAFAKPFWFLNTARGKSVVTADL
mgnify:CR=1 FL=1